jgi:hypothetical protein
MGVNTMSKYQRARERIRNMAIEWQNDFENHDYSYGDLIYWEDYFRGLAKKYGLVREFEENGII